MKSQNSTDVSCNLTNRYGNLTQFLTSFNPDKQYELSVNVDDCYFGSYPTLATLNRDYCKTAAVQWLNVQIYNLNEFCGCKDKMTPEQILDCARTINAMYYYLKVSELMLFFFRFKAGMYLSFFGSIDALTITQSIVRFLRERNDANNRNESKIAMQRLSEYKKNAITYEEYQRRKLNHKSQENGKEEKQ